MSLINFEVTDKKFEIFGQENLRDPRFYTTTTYTTVSFQFLHLLRECHEWYLFSFFPIFSKILFFKKFHFMAHWAS